MTSNELRQAYLDFFVSKGHKVVASAPLVPDNDPSTLFTGSGMQPMVPYLLGEAHPEGTRICDSQKCFRAKDIEEVGDNRHTTFFEMLGNWSLGDYFKKEQVSWMFEFLTQKVGLDPKQLYVTTFRGNDSINIPRDEETVKLWQEAFASVGIDAKAVDFSERDGMGDGRIFYYDEKKNWWSRSGTPDHMPVGEPGGPDTEMFWDFGADLKLHENSSFAAQPCHVNCDCGRFMEIGNNVFMQYKKTDVGFVLLPKQNVDFGGGLERMAAALRNDPDMLRVDLFDRARAVIETATGKRYGADSTETISFRVILDHLRAATFLIGDGIVPSNKDQGYFVRRLIRRAVRFGNKIGARETFCAQVAEAYIETYKTAYPDLLSKKDFIVDELKREEDKFKETLELGLKKMIDELENRPLQKNVLDGITLYNLYQSFGFPMEVSLEVANERGYSLQENALSLFEDLMKSHRDLSRSGSEQKFSGGLADHSEISTKYHTATHLLHQALRMVLGDHVAQKGSNITQERLRFDFSHGDKLTDDQIKKVEAIVNEQIQKDLPVHFDMLTVAEAKEKGAIGLFEDKYASLGDKIKVYSVGSEEKGYFSKEICGGPHVEHTGTMGHFHIVKEEASSAGVRRIKAVLE